MRRLVPSLAFLALVSSVPGCHTGQEAAIIRDAYADRGPDGRVTVHATLGCGLVRGRARAHGCDADGSEVCIEAKWFEARDEQFQSPLHEARSCAHHAVIDGAKATAVSEEAIPPIDYTAPRDRWLRIRVRAETPARQDREVVVSSP